MEAKRQAGLRCPICGNGVLADIAYDEHHPPVDPPKQAPESGEVVTFTCGHEVEVGRLVDAARYDPNVERRTSDDVVDPGPAGGIAGGSTVSEANVVRTPGQTGVEP